MSSPANLVDLDFIEQLDRNLKSSPQFIQVVLGPRQIGKTTSILNYLEKRYQNPFLYFSAEKRSHNQTAWLIEKWNEARKNKCLLVVDEIQKIENWSETVKKLYDEDRRVSAQMSYVLLALSTII
jgi:predicted AAA+ superfamily ATPase